MSFSIFSRFITRFISGIKIAYNGFIFIKTNAQLHIFFIIPTILILIEKLLVKTKYLSTNALTIIKKFGDYYTINCNGSTYTKIYDGWLYLMAAISILIFLIIITLSVIAITIIVNNTKNGKYLETKKLINLFVPKIKTGIIWAVITFILFYGPTIVFSIYKVDPKIFYILNSTISLIYLAFLLISSFVIQAIAIDNLGLYKAIKLSVCTIYNLFFEYLGIIFMISIISGIFWLILKILTLLLLAAGVVNISGPIGLYKILLYSAFTIIAAISTEIIIFVYDISKTLLFINFKQKK